MGMADTGINETTYYDNAVESYIGWLRSVHLLLATPNCGKKETGEKSAIIVNIDGIPLDISEEINDIMLMGMEHFKLLAKQVGIYAFEN